MYSEEEIKAGVAFIEGLKWPVPLPVFMALAKTTIMSTVDLAIIRKCGSVPKILLARRPVTDPFFASLWHIPGCVIIPGQTALSAIEHRVLKPDVGITLSGEPEFLMVRDILMGDPGPNTSPRGQEIYRLFHYILQDSDPEILVDEVERMFCRLDQVPEDILKHQIPSFERLRAIHGV